MGTKTLSPSTSRRVDRQFSRCLLLLTLLCQAAMPLLADGRQATTKISVAAAEGSNGSKDATDPDIFTIQCGPYQAGQQAQFCLTLNEAASYPVSVELRYVGLEQYAGIPDAFAVDGEETDQMLVTFAPGETRKVVSFMPEFDLEYMPRVVGRKPVYFELLYPSRATLDVRLVELTFDFDCPPDADWTFSENYNSVRGNYDVPLFSQDGYAFLFMAPQNDETGEDAYVRLSSATRYNFTVGNVDFDALAEEFPTSLPQTTHDAAFVPRQQEGTRSSIFSALHHFSEAECVRDNSYYSNQIGGGSTYEFTLMSTIGSAGPFFSAASTDDTAPTTLSAEDITAYEGENTQFELIHAVPYINNVSTAQQSYTAGAQVDLAFTISNWRFCYTFYRETLLQQLFVTFDGGQTRQPLTSATMKDGRVTASVKAPAEAGSYCLEIGVVVSDYTDVNPIATEEYYPAAAFTDVTIAEGTPAVVPISKMTIEGVPDVIRYTTEDTHRQYQAYVAVDPVTATCPAGTWSISRKDGTPDDILSIDDEGRLTFRAEDIDRWGFEYGYAKSGQVVITFTAPDFTLSKEVTLLPAVPTGITFYNVDQRQDVYGTPRDVVVDYQLKADEAWTLATTGTATMTVTAKDGVKRTVSGIDVSSLRSERIGDVLHVYVPLTLNDHEFSLKERHGRTFQLVWTVKTDISLPFTNSISGDTYTVDTYRYINYAYDPVYADEWPKAAFPLCRDVTRGKTDYVVTHAYNLAKDYFYISWAVASDDNCEWGSGGYNFTRKQYQEWSSTEGMENKPDWLQLTDCGDYYNAKIVVPVETGTFNAQYVPVIVYIGASCEPGEYNYFVPTSYIHYASFSKEDLHIYLQCRYSATDNDDVIELAEGEHLDLNDQDDIDAFNQFLASYKQGDDIFGQIAALRKSHILAISPQYNGPVTYGAWAARDNTKIKITGGLLGQKELTATAGYGQFIYFPMADATYTIEISNELFETSRTFTYTTHALPHADDIYAFKSYPGFYKVGGGDAHSGYSMTDQINLSYLTKNGTQGYVEDCRHGRSNSWFYEPDDIVSYNAIDLNGRMNFGSMGFVRGFREPYAVPQFTAADTGMGSGGGLISFSKFTSMILGELENDNAIQAGTNFDNDGQLHLTIHDLMGEPVSEAHVNYVAVGADGQPSGKGSGRIAASADGRATLPLQDLITDQTNESIYLEVVATGYEPKFYKFNQLEESYRNGFNSVPSNELDLVLEMAGETTTQLSRADLMSIVEANADTTAVTFAITDMTAFNLVDKISYKEDGPLGGTKTIHTLTVVNGTYKYAKRWEGEKLVQLNLTFLPKSSALNYSQMRLTGLGNLKDAMPTRVATIDKNVFTGFEHDYIDASFDLVGFVANEKMAIPVLKIGDVDLAQLPKLHNEEIDMDSIARNTKINITPNPDFNPGDIGRESAKRGSDLGDDNQALFDQIDFDFPDVMGFQFQVRKVGNHFQVRGVYSKNFLPGGDEADMVDSFAEEMVGYANQFDKVFKDCVDACTGGSGGDEDFDFLYGNDPLFATNDAFVGIRAFISGVAYLGPKGEFMMNFHEGGIKLEMSGEYTHKCSFGIGSFGAKLSGELSTQLKLINHKAAAGDVYNFSLNVMIENEVRAEIVAWATAGLNILNLVKAEVGVRGGVSASYKSGISYPLYGNPGSNGVYAGHKLSLRSGMFIYADARFLWWRKHWEKWLFKFSKDFCWPDDASNPYSSSFAYGEPIFSSRAMGGRSWKKVKARRVVGLGETLMNDVSGMASPRLFNGGQSIIYNKLNSPTDYNDDRLMMRSLAAGTDTDVNPDATGAAFAFDVAERGDQGAMAFEQYRTDDLSANAVEQSTSMDDMNQLSAGVDVVASLWDGSSWQTTNISALISSLNPSSVAGDLESPTTANLSPRVAVQDDGHAAVVWLSGTPMATDAADEADRQQYLDGRYLLSRYDGTSWSQPIELAKLNRSFVVSDHRMVMHDDSLLIVMEHHDDLTSKDNPYIDYITVTPKNTVSISMGVERGRGPQVVRLDEMNIVAYLTERPDSTQDIRLRTVDMAGSHVANTDSYARLGKRSVGAFKLAATADAASLDDLALIWTQSVLNPESDEAESWLCAGRFGKSGQQLYVSYPEQVVQIPDDFTPSAFDGYIDQNNLHVIYALSDIQNDGTAVIQKDVTFTNSIRVKQCNVVAANATTSTQIPFQLSVQNTGYTPVTTVTADIGASSVEFSDLCLLPGQTADLAGYFAIDPDHYTGQEQVDITADFGGMDVALARRRTSRNAAATALNNIEMPRLVQRTVTPRTATPLPRRGRGRLLGARRAASDPSMTATTSVDCAVEATDLSCTVLSNRIKGKQNTVIAKVTNCSPLPLLAGQTVTAGLYASAADTETIEGTTPVTIPISDLYADGRPLSKVIRLQAANLPADQQAFIKVVVGGTDKVVADVRPENNHVPVSLYATDGNVMTILGDANGDGVVNFADVLTVTSYILGRQPQTFLFNAADVNFDGTISVADAAGIVDIRLKK